MDALEFLRSRNRFEEELPSGLKVTIRLPRVRDCIIAGGVPLPALEHVMAASSSSEAVPDITNEDAMHMARFQDELVRAAIVAIEGEPVELDLADVAEFDQRDYDKIVALATRQETSPKAGAST